MKLYQALKQKNKLVGEISQLQHIIQSNNSISVKTKKIYDVKEKLNDLNTKINDLIELKININKANQDIQEKIYLLSEYKSLVKFYSSLNTMNGEVVNYSGVAQEFSCEIDEIQKNEFVNNLKDKIDNIQDEIDIYNHTTNI